VVKRHIQHIVENLERRIVERPYKEAGDGVYVGENVEIGPFVAFDTRQGPIVIESGVVIGSHASLVGPLHIGAGAKILPHAALLGRVALGETTKIGGEVEDSIVEPFSNKQHYGFLGHSYVGSWVNLGAGTSNSDLKNTYGEVHLDVGGRRVSTGMQMLGCFLGDYVKSAVNTSIFTGKLVGPGSMLYGFVTTNVPSFVNYAKSFDQVTEIPVDVLESMQARMFARRGKEPRPCDVALLRAMHARTQAERLEAVATPIHW
ncbi:MAG TPA: glucose-1-phosphate thymidylyltransferase, partial [Pirellulales bacterium]